MADNTFDVLVIGAGISGINAGYRIQTELPHKSYAILEARGDLGGTWDFFRYPGIRSDSDLHTFGFPWEPWKEHNAIAEGDLIKKYLTDTANKYGITQHIRYHHKMLAMDWSSEQQMWTVTVLINGEKQTVYHGRFILLSTGYYDYETPLQTTIPGLDTFKGTIVHPQFWPSDLTYTGKKIVIIGSGATAVTLLPNLARSAKHVTMLQRSPGYLINMPQVDRFERAARAVLPGWLFHKVIRVKWLVLPWLFFNFCRSFPLAARRALKKRTQKELPADLPHNPHFDPWYNPWEQRMCVCPDGDFFECLRNGTASVATGHIDTVTEHGITLKSGETLEADMIVTATGLKIQMAGGARIALDGERFEPSEKFLWKSMMLQDLPNASYVIGYTNASWTLGADATALAFCRLLKFMDAEGKTSMIPRVDRELKETSMLNLNSTYVQKGRSVMPKAGDSGPWQAKKSYFWDLFQAKFGDIQQGVQFYRVST